MELNREHFRAIIFYKLRRGLTQQVIRFRLLVFLIFCKTTGKQMVLYHSELIVLVVRLRHVQYFRKNRRPFAWKCFGREQLLLDLAYLETFIQPTAVCFRAHTRKSTNVINVFRSIAIVFLEHFFVQSTRAFF